MIDGVATITKQTTRKGFFGKENNTFDVEFDLAKLSQLWNASNKFGLGVELVAYGEDGWSQTDLDALLDKLDRRGLNPFNYAEVYETIYEFLSFLPYRPNLQGVIDRPDRILRYGSYGINIDTLGRG